MRLPTVRTADRVITICTALRTLAALHGFVGKRCRGQTPSFSTATYESSRSDLEMLRCDMSKSARRQGLELPDERHTLEWPSNDWG